MNNGIKRLLYVEDIEVNQLIIKSMVSRMEGYAIQCAEDGTEALKQLAENKFDLVLTDLFLPDMDGFTLYEKYQAQGQDHLVPFIALTSDISLESKEKAEKLSFIGYLEKPVRPEELAAILEEAFK